VGRGHQKQLRQPRSKNSLAFKLIKLFKRLEGDNQIKKKHKEIND
jgi:hypothetical protein